MKRLLSFILAIYVISCASVAFALSKQQIALGGIPLDAPLTYVNSIYGAPSHIDGGSRWISYYGNGFLVYSSPRPKLHNEEKEYKVGVNYVDSIKVTQNNGISTPDGAYVGMKENVVEKIYGEPFSKYKGKDETMIYWYFADTQLLALEARNGIVTTIRIEETN